MITYAGFTTDFPEFATAPQGQFNFYLQFASLMLTAPWGQAAPAGQPYTLYDIGTELFIAHNLALESLNAIAASAGGTPGLIPGVVSETVTGQVTVNYDVAASTELDAGHWNMTTYGTRFVQMLRLIGAAPSQISPAGPCIPNNGPAWVGPAPWPGYFG